MAKMDGTLRSLLEKIAKTYHDMSLDGSNAKLTINGQTVNPINSLLVKRGWSKEYIYVLADTVKRGESKNYEIIAYNAGGTPSAAKTVTG